MIDQADTQTVDLFAPQKRGRGRPSTGKALTPAEKQKAYRERLKSRNFTENKNGNVTDKEINDHAEKGALMARCRLLEAECAKLQALATDWRDKYYQRDIDYNRDLEAVIKQKNQAVAAQKGLVTKYRNERDAALNRVESLERQLASATKGNLLR
ncbi:hypothetical protein BJL95_21330 [Methylomonas sp. LWB]|uniref:hypothetical protein n=1 Tax=Methylomonas sp. LWB TaxID=1905845 RepID=UPI0008DA56A1|nr:hypothetical protein [Methylomonas sp. LWB]OHX37211.1 hypothetical protein BJL95_21330 [Methylomonas sp. LWB]